MSKRIGLIFLFYIGITALLLWPLPIHLGNSVINAGDPLFYAWNLIHNWQALTHGGRGLLDTNIYYPTTNTLAFSDTLFAQTLFTFPVLWLFNNPLLAQNLYVFLTFPIAGIGMYLLAYWVTKNTRASILAGLFYAFSLPRLGQIGHATIISSQWFPFFFWSLLRFLKHGQKKDALLSSIFFLVLMTSTVYFGVFAIIATMVILGTYLLLSIRQKQMSIFFLRLKQALPLLLPLIIITLVVNYPYIRLKAEYPDIHRSIEESSARGAYQEDFTSVLPTTMVLGSILPTKEGERALYPTLTLLALAILVFRYRKSIRENNLAFFSILAITTLVLAFGPERPFHVGSLTTGYLRLPYYYVFKFFPLLQIIRVPARFSILFILSLSVLAALTLSHGKLFNRRKGISVIIGFIFLIEIWQFPLQLVPVPPYSSAPPVYTWLKNEPIPALVELPIGKIEEGKTPIPLQVTKKIHEITQDDPLAAEAYRVYFAGLHEHFTANGYSGFIPTSFHETEEAMRSFPNETSLEFLSKRNILYIVIHTNQYAPQQWTIMQTRIEQQPKLKKIQAFQHDFVYKIETP